MPQSRHDIIFALLCVWFIPLGIVSSKYRDSDQTSQARLCGPQSYVYAIALGLFLFTTVGTKAAVSLDVYAVSQDSAGDALGVCTPQ